MRSEQGQLIRILRHANNRAAAEERLGRASWSCGNMFLLEVLL
jgi:hypothetical protein